MKKNRLIASILLVVSTVLPLSSCSDTTKAVTGLVASEILGKETVEDAMGVIGEIQGYIMSGEKFSYEDGYKDGIITEKGWENEFFDIKFSLPEKYKMAPKDELAEDEYVKTEMEAYGRFKDEFDQRYTAVVSILVEQASSEFSDDGIRDGIKKSGEKMGRKLLSEGETTIANKNFYVTNWNVINENGVEIFLKEADLRKGDKILTIETMYSPEDWDPKLENAFDTLK